MNWMNFLLIGLWAMFFGFWQHSLPAGFFMFLIPAVLVIIRDWRD